MLSHADLMSAAASLCEQLSLARGSALRGDYATAEVFYQGVAAQITRCVGHCRAQAWSRALFLPSCWLRLTA